jgi:hypothetical protein
MKPVLKASASLLLKLRYDGPLSSVAINFNLRHYTVADALEKLAERSIISAPLLRDDRWGRVNHALATSSHMRLDSQNEGLNMLEREMLPRGPKEPPGSRP